MYPGDTYTRRLLGSGRGIVAWQRLSRFRRAARELRTLSGGRAIGTLLDIGAADGIGLPFWRPLAARVVSLNRFSDHSAEFHRSHLSEAIITGDARSLPFAAGAFGAVVSLETLHLLNKPADRLRCLDEIHRILAPDGLFLCSVPVELGLPALVKYLGRRVTHNDVVGLTGGVALRLCFHRLFSMERYEETAEVGFDAHRFAAAVAQRFTIRRRPRIPLPWPLCTNLMLVCTRR